MLVTWLGDPEDRSQTETEFSTLGTNTPNRWTLHFIKGDPVEVPDDHPMAEKIRNNQSFSVEGYAAPAPPKVKGKPGRKPKATEPDDE